MKEEKIQYLLGTNSIYIITSEKKNYCVITGAAHPYFRAFMIEFQASRLGVPPSRMILYAASSVSFNSPSIPGVADNTDEADKQDVADNADVVENAGEVDLVGNVVGAGGNINDGPVHGVCPRLAGTDFSVGIAKET